MTIPSVNYVFCHEYSLWLAYLIIWQKWNKFSVAGNHEFRGKDSRNSVERVSEVSSFVGKPVILE